MKKQIFSLLQLLVCSIFVLQLCGSSIADAQSSSNYKLLGVVIMANGNKIKIKGYCIYVKNGKEIRKKLEKDNAWGWNFRGDYIKEVKIQKVSGDASYRLFIMEGKDSSSGRAVFESDLISSTKPVVYKRN